MQSLTASPREHLTATDVIGLLTGDQVTIDGGLELLDTSNRFVEDITDDLLSGQVRWDNRSAVHGSLQISIQRELVWGRDRVRPYMVFTHGDLSARFNLGVYLVTQPDEDRSEDPVTYDVTCYGLLTVWQDGPAETWVAASGTSYFDAVTAIHAASGIGAPLLLPGALADVSLPATRVWALMSPIPSWLRMMTDLLLEVGYTAPFVDENGSICTRPFQPLEVRASEWTLDTRDAATNLVYDSRTLSIEADDIPNSWLFVWSDKPGTPVDGNGIYRVENLTGGPAAQETILRVVHKYVPLQATDHAALVTQGDKIVAGDMAAARTMSLTIDPLPIMGFDDVFTFVDTTAAGVESEKVLAASWTLNLDGSAGQLQLGGAPRAPLDEVSTSGRGTITDDSPLSVVVDGATVPSFANALDGGVYSIGDRVTLTVRNPLPPLIQGVES